MTAALLHDIGHGAYSHTFEGLFGTDHEKMTQLIITSPETEVNQILLQVAPDFPNRVASVIDHTYPNKQVVQLDVYKRQLLKGMVHEYSHFLLLPVA